MTDIVVPAGKPISEGSTTVRLGEPQWMFARESSKTMAPSTLQKTGVTVLVGGAPPHPLATRAAEDALAAALAKLGDELRFVLITSAADVQPLASAPADAVETEVAGLKLKIHKSAHTKCGRCWHHRADVGQFVKHPELCGRCVENIEGAGEVRHYA